MLRFPASESDHIQPAAFFSKYISDSTFVKAIKLRWHMLMFGLVEPPKKMELKDIRISHTQRSPLSMFTAFNGEGIGLGVCYGL
ncbi:hypothetical protein GIB67_022523 [Kingdonia uniflora]|uniref:Uncharacterized protein n=1 Tax=Kingdonia uniflora TaxID=39325 RepID=A0A7J7L7F3_9MAGN|nr:hypothetical protein GIB67_022523 [Kingdonia uniflora]